MVRVVREVTSTNVESSVVVYVVRWWSDYICNCVTIVCTVQCYIQYMYIHLSRALPTYLYLLFPLRVSTSYLSTI